MPASRGVAVGAVLAALLLGGCQSGDGPDGADVAEDPMSEETDNGVDDGARDPAGADAGGLPDGRAEGDADSDVADADAEDAGSRGERSGGGSDPDAPFLEGYGQGDYPEFEGERDEYRSTVADCLEDAGWPTEVSADGSEMSVDVAGDQRVQFMEAREECRYEVGVPPPLEPLDEDELSRLYDRTLEAKACLEAEGVDVPEPPSREAFVETYYEGGAWVPHSGLPVGQAEWQRLNEVCPQPALD